VEPLPGFISLSEFPHPLLERTYVNGFCPTKYTGNLALNNANEKAAFFLCFPASPAPVTLTDISETALPLTDLTKNSMDVIAADLFFCNVTFRPERSRQNLCY
jgi:hypothetical protein